MEKQIKNLSRKRFLSWGLGVTSIIAVPSFLRRFKKHKDLQKVKMLTQDGLLVEIEVENIPVKKEKIKEGDIHNWVHKKSSSL